MSSKLDHYTLGRAGLAALSVIAGQEALQNLQDELGRGDPAGHPYKQSSKLDRYIKTERCRNELT